MIFCHSLNMTSLNTFFSFFNMPASEFVKRYRKYMLKYNIKEMEDEEEGFIVDDTIYQKYLLSDIEYNMGVGNTEPPEELSEDEEYICVCTIKDLYYLYIQYKHDLLHLSYEDFELYLKMHDQDKLENFPIGKVYSPNIDTFMPSFEDTEISSKFTYYCIEIYYNTESKEYEYIE